MQLKQSTHTASAVDMEEDEQEDDTSPAFSSLIGNTANPVTHRKAPADRWIQAVDNNRKDLRKDLRTEKNCKYVLMSDRNSNP